MSLDAKEKIGLLKLEGWFIRSFYMESYRVSH
jgi:hypothetical protein